MGKEEIALDGEPTTMSDAEIYRDLWTSAVDAGVSVYYVSENLFGDDFDEEASYERAHDGAPPMIRILRHGFPDDNLGRSKTPGPAASPVELMLLAHELGARDV